MVLPGHSSSPPELQRSLILTKKRISLLRGQNAGLIKKAFSITFNVPDRSQIADSIKRYNGLPKQFFFKF